MPDADQRFNFPVSMSVRARAGCAASVPPVGAPRCAMAATKPFAWRRSTPDARAPNVRRYLSLAPGPRAFIPIDRDAPLEEFQKVAPRVPVFRVRSDCEARSASARTEEEPWVCVRKW
jgi:hypothetical protein